MFFLIIFHIQLVADADIQFTFPVQSSEEEELRLIFNWKSALMSDLAKFDNDDSLYPSDSFADQNDYYHGQSVQSLIKLLFSSVTYMSMMCLLLCSTRWLCAERIQGPLRRAVDVRVASPPGTIETDPAL